ncbi:MAG TPA: MaoC/PaaZ C-terminal domain-containing protein [Bryobacteraceae bacterium]|nr:MaoC/PaaZ C-terminal domain-containing protein [Bryobacteraceae bacterium]
MYYEDFELDSVRTSRTRTITEADIVNFAGLSGDFVELHVSETYAAAGPFGKRIAHGVLVFSIAAGLSVQVSQIQDTVIAFYGIDRLRFTKPVFIGDTIHVVKRVTERQSKGEGRGLLTFETSVLNQHGELVIIYSDKVLLKTRG